LADQVSLIRLETVETQPVFLRVNGDSSELELVGGPEESNGDFAAIQREELPHLDNTIVVPPAEDQIYRFQQKTFA